MLHRIRCTVQYTTRDSITDQCGIHHPLSLSVNDFVNEGMRMLVCSAHSLCIQAPFTTQNRYWWFYKAAIVFHEHLSFRELLDQPIHLIYFCEHTPFHCLLYNVNLRCFIMSPLVQTKDIECHSSMALSFDLQMALTEKIFLEPTKNVASWNSQITFVNLNLVFQGVDFSANQLSI